MSKWLSNRSGPDWLMDADGRMIGYRDRKGGEYRILQTSESWGASYSQANPPAVNLDANGDIQANITPRTGTLASLLALTSGGGEICAATDVAALVLLSGSPGSGTAAKIPAMDGSTYLDIYELSAAAIRAEPAANATGASINIWAGNNAGAGPGGDVTINGGTGGGGNGTVTMRSPGLFRVLTDNDQPTIQARNVGYNSTGGELAFFGNTPIAKPTVTGSRAGNAALASLLTVLGTMGLITNSSTA